MKPTLTLVTSVLLLAVGACPRTNDVIGEGAPGDSGAGGALGSSDDGPHVTYDASGAAMGADDGPKGGNFVPSGGPPALDLVFVIDDSDSMRTKQQALAASLPRLLDELGKVPGGMPSLHVGVISTNFGAGPNVPASACPPYGDKGRFQVKAGCGLDANANPWLEESGSMQNFAGQLPAALSCLTQLGTTGCGYEHTLQALRAGLYDVNPENRGFLRYEAWLGIVILSDEDDCSAEPFATLFDDALPNGRAPSLACSLLGHVCQGQEVPPAPGWNAPLSSCVPYQRQQDHAYDDHPEQDPIRNRRLINVSEMIDFIKAKKPQYPERIVVSTIIGWDASPGATYRVDSVVKNNPPRTELDNVPICASANGSATPGIRLKAFTDGFGANGRVYSICDDPGATAAAIGRTLAVRFGAPAN
jgi:hypothetical protein